MGFLKVVGTQIESDRAGCRGDERHRHARPKPQIQLACSLLLVGEGNKHSVLFGSFGRKIDGFRFPVYLVVFSHLPGKPIDFPQKDACGNQFSGPVEHVP